MFLLVILKVLGLHLSNYNRKRKYAEKIKNNTIFIKPIKGCHRILDWHKVRGKLHCLAGGQTILHTIPIEIPDDKIQKFIKEKKLEDLVDENKNEK